MAFDTMPVGDTAVVDDESTNKTKMGKEFKVDVTIPVKDPLECTDYETAISIAGYGRYNRILLVATACAITSSLFSTSTISFILPSATYDLQITNFDKGILNAVIYVGMIATGFIWGFLSDTLGRQKLLFIGYALDAIFNIVAGMAQNYTVLLLAKLADGLVCAGPYAIMMTYLAECNPDSHRASLVQMTGIITAVGTILLPLMAWCILPLDFSGSIMEMEFNAWRVFLLVSAIPSIIAALSFCFRWESPKFLLSKGRSEEALKIIRQMYSINTGKHPCAFPVKYLKMEKPEPVKLASDLDGKSTLRGVLASFKPVASIFRPPYLSRAVVVFLFQFGALMGYNTIRLWMPQLFATIMHAESLNVTDVTNVCGLLELSKPEQDFEEEIANIKVDTNVYFNSIVIGCVSVVGFIIANWLTRIMGDIYLILAGTAVSVISCVGMYWGLSSDIMLAFSSLFVTCTSITSTAILSVTLQHFPTESRTMAIALVMMSGQTGGVLGNVLFPILLDWNCTVPFFLWAALLGVSGSIVLLLPRGEKLEKV